MMKTKNAKGTPSEELVKMYRAWKRVLPIYEEEILSPDNSYTYIVALTAKIRRLRQGINWFEYQFGKNW